ncbi:MAG: cation diffusion facilitator family transporter [Burkholderiales bacterium]
MEKHPHSHDHHHHHHQHGGMVSPQLGWALLLTFGFALVELVGGLWSGSLALMSDAGHMFLDSFALALALFASWVARRPASARHSYGLVRAEVIAAAANGLSMLVIIVLIVVEAIERLQDPVPVAGGSVIVIAFLGLVVNIAAAAIISRGERTLNVRAALVHVMGDLLGSIAALIAGAVIYFTGWMPVDPILSLAIAVLILVSTLSLLREALHLLMEGVPAEIELDAVARTLLTLPGVRSVHDLHIWTIASGRVALTAHLDVAGLGDWPHLLERARRLLHESYDIDHITLQPEPVDGIQPPYRPAITIVPRE